MNKGLRFILLIGVLSFFADFAYEGARSVTGPFLGILGASAFVVSVVAGFGELAGYGLRLVSGPLAERTGKFWPITIVGYVVQMAAVPLLALAGNWQTAAALIVLERAGKATRNPPRDVMLSHAGRGMGFGWAFGIHEALDQAGALIGPLVIAAILAAHGSYQQAFAVLAIPAAIVIVLLILARVLYPTPQNLEHAPPPVAPSNGFAPVYWLYLCGAALVAAGFADFALISYHFGQSLGMHAWLPISYAIAMACGGASSLLFGKLFDRFGTIVLVPLTVLSAAFAPLVFFGNFSLAIVGAAVWGIGMGVHESIVPAAVAHMVPQNRRASAYGIFTGVYGIAWFLGSAIIGLLYLKSVTLMVIFCVATQLLAIPIFALVARRMIPERA